MRTQPFLTTSGLSSVTSVLKLASGILIPALRADAYYTIASVCSRKLYCIQQ
jgi:hypothetical protein